MLAKVRHIEAKIRISPTLEKKNHDKFKSAITRSKQNSTTKRLTRRVLEASKTTPEGLPG